MKRSKKPVRKVKKKGKKAKKITKKKTVKKKPVKKAKKKVAKKTKNVKSKKTGKQVKKPVRKAPKKVIKRVEAPPKIKYPVVPLADSLRVKMLVSVLKELVRRKIISDWRINFGHKRSAELYVGSEFVIEDALTAMREDVTVTLYKRFDDMIGETQVPVLTEDREEAKEQLIAASAACNYAKKKAYTLPQPQPGLVFAHGYDSEMVDRFLKGEGMAVAEGIYTHMVELLKSLDVKTNCFEILTSTLSNRVLNSEDVDVSWHKTVIHVNVVLSYKTQDDEQEFHWSTTVVSPEQLNLRIALEKQAAIARDAAQAAQGEEFIGDVLLAGQGLIDFFAPADQHSPIVLHTFAKLKQMKIARLHAGKPLGDVQGEPFTLASNPHLPLGLLTMPVDEEGTPAHPVELIRMGVVMNHIAQAKHAQHMNLPLTGNMANVHIGEGATREEHLRGFNYVEIVSFSWFNPDPYSGDFSAEVRLGYKWERGKKTPFKGGFFSGNVFTNLLNTRFSREVTQAGRYYGPRAILFKDARVSKPK